MPIELRAEDWEAVLDAVAPLLAPEPPEPDALVVPADALVVPVAVVVPEVWDEKNDNAMEFLSKREKKLTDAKRSVDWKVWQFDEAGIRGV
jgi:hypothetical protein